MGLPEMDAVSRKRPLCYDPGRQKFITFDDIISGREKIVPVESLSKEDLKKLVMARWRELPADISPVQAMRGQPHSREDVLRAIERDEPFGQITIEAEKSYLRDLLKEIQLNLK